jgi:hypothetical protein
VGGVLEAGNGWNIASMERISDCWLFDKEITTIASGFLRILDMISGRLRTVQLLILVACILMTFRVLSQDAGKDPQSQPADLPISSAVGNLLPATDEQWRFSIAFPMLWAPSISGKIRGDESIDFTIEFKDILENLSFGLMFELYANKGPYGLVYRSNFMRVKDENSRSGLLETRIKTELDMGVNDLLASFRVHEKVRLVAGVRNVYAKMDLKIRSTIGSEDLLNEKINITDSNMFDFLFGLNFDHWFNDDWGIMLNADLGIAGDNDRDFSTEFRALYRISDLNNLWFGYRYLNIGNDSNSDGLKYKIDMSQSGPTFGWAFTF